MNAALRQLIRWQGIRDMLRHLRQCQAEGMDLEGAVARLERLSETMVREATQDCGCCPAGASAPDAALAAPRREGEVRDAA